MDQSMKGIISPIWKKERARWASLTALNTKETLNKILFVDPASSRGLVGSSTKESGATIWCTETALSPGKTKTTIRVNLWMTNPKAEELMSGKMIMVVHTWANGKPVSSMAKEQLLPKTHGGPTTRSTVCGSMEDINSFYGKPSTSPHNRLVKIYLYLERNLTFLSGSCNVKSPLKTWWSPERS